MNRPRLVISGALACLLVTSAAAQGPETIPLPQVVPSLSWKAVGIGAGAIGLAALADAAIGRSVQGNTSARTLQTARAFDRLAEVPVITGVVGGMALVGVLGNNTKLKRGAVQLAGGILVGVLITQPMKYAVGRSRPYEDGDRGADDFTPFGGQTSFPSGHSVTAFTIATSLGDLTDNNWARAGFYTLATGAAWGRVALEKHWLSDVVAGAAVGYVSAKFASGRLRIFGLDAPKLVVGRDGTGFNWTVPLRHSIQH